MNRRIDINSNSGLLLLSSEDPKGANDEQPFAIYTRHRITHFVQDVISFNTPSVDRPLCHTHTYMILQVRQRLRLVREVCAALQGRPVPGRKAVWGGTHRRLTQGRPHGGRSRLSPKNFLSPKYICNIFIYSFNIFYLKKRSVLSPAGRASSALSTRGTRGRRAPR